MKNIITLILLGICVLGIAQPTGWLYNQPITVTNPNNTAVNNYQLRLTINTQNLIGAGQMQASGDDIRFAGTCTSTAFYGYWIESGINTASTVIWVKLPQLPANGTVSFFMFYGNPSAGSLSSIPATFRGPNSSTDSVAVPSTNLVPGSQRGFRFQPTQDLLVTHFGKMEPSGTTRYITLFDFTSTSQLQQIQVAGAGTTSYTYGALPNPMWLNSATQYVLQMYQGSNDSYYYGNSSQIGQHLSYLDMRYCNSCTQNTFPTLSLANLHYGLPDFLYYIATTLAITPTYTLAPTLGTITGPNAICNSGTATLSTNSAGSFTWSTGATTSSIVVAVSTNTTFFITTAGNNFMCPAITISVNSGLPTLNVSSPTPTVCLGQTAVLTASGAITHTWTGGITNGVPFTPNATSNYTVTGVNGCGSVTAVSTITVAPLPVVAIATPSLICAADAATLSAGGAGTYTWIPGNLTGNNITVSPGVPTTYTVLGTTSVCAGSATVSLSVDPNPTVVVSASTPSVCEGDPAVLTVSGANTYSWSHGGTATTVTVNPVASTLYQVTGYNTFNCPHTAAVPILVQPLPPVQLATNRSQICAGASATLTASGANSWLWDDNSTANSRVVSPVVSSVYTVTGTSSLTTCSDTKTIAVNIFTVGISVPPGTTICEGQSVLLFASGASSYTWTHDNSTNAFTNVSPSITTTYVLSTITNTNGMQCPNLDSITVTVNPLPVITVTVNRPSICRNESTTLTATGAQNYTWSTGQQTNTLVLKGNSNTTYSLTVIGIDQNLCENSSPTATVKVNPCTGIEQMAERLLTISPNPGKGEFIISTPGAVRLSILSETGQLIRTIDFARPGDHRLELHDLSAGLYFLSGTFDGNRLYEKLIIEK